MRQDGGDFSLHARQGFPFKHRQGAGAESGWHCQANRGRGLRLSDAAAHGGDVEERVLEHAIEGAQALDQRLGRDEVCLLGRIGEGRWRREWQVEIAEGGTRGGSPAGRDGMAGALWRLGNAETGCTEKAGGVCVTFLFGNGFG